MAVHAETWKRLRAGERVVMSGDDYDALCEWLQTVEDDNGANQLASIPAGEEFRAWLLTDEQMKTRTECQDAVRGPGKFEGESPHSFYFYEAHMNGDGEELGTFDGCAVLAFDVSAEDVELFPDLAGVARVYFYERED